VHDQLCQKSLWKETEESARVDYPGNVGENELSTSFVPELIGRRFLVFNRGPVAQLGARFHGMEEVVGSIPTRSTNSLRSLDRASARNPRFCVMVCVITRRSGAHRKGFHRCPLPFHPHVAIPFQHATAAVRWAAQTLLPLLGTRPQVWLQSNCHDDKNSRPEEDDRVQPCKPRNHHLRFV
jgi:hypothetical protein